MRTSTCNSTSKSRASKHAWPHSRIKSIRSSNKNPSRPNITSSAFQTTRQKSPSMRRIWGFSSNKCLKSCNSWTIAENQSSIASPYSNKVRKRQLQNYRKVSKSGSKRSLMALLSKLGYSNWSKSFRTLKNNTIVTLNALSPGWKIIYQMSPSRPIRNTIAGSSRSYSRATKPSNKRQSGWWITSRPSQIPTSTCFELRCSIQPRRVRQLMAPPSSTKSSSSSRN